eukprot:TRINITY_DN5123_c0_g1_i2.p1 TRINITY_DN5123_c0_g1~~TRINITY_DN5123_c0_g1_i2.p1  ORF type:complete len:650 (+),score=113.18 TRINITY_DN5123_c0_g1_i2:380-2329(+)
MELQTKERNAGESSIPLREQFMANFEGFTRGVLKNIHSKEKNDILVVGSVISACLEKIPQEHIGRETEFFDNGHWKSSDIDLTIIDLDQEETENRIRDIYKTLVKDHPNRDVTIVSTTEALTFCLHYPYRHIQIMGNFQSVADVLYDVDIDITAMGYDGSDIWLTPRALVSLNRKWNVASPEFYKTKGCPQYERRLLKYSTRGYSIVDLNFKWTYLPQLNLDEPDKKKPFRFKYDAHNSKSIHPAQGLELLLLCEKYDWVHEKLMSLQKESIPFGEGIMREEMAIILEQLDDYPDEEDEQNLDFNNYDNYTHWYTKPVIKPIELVLKSLHLFGRSQPFLVPFWYSSILIEYQFGIHYRRTYNECYLDNLSTKKFYRGQLQNDLTSFLLEIEIGTIDINETNVDNNTPLLYCIINKAPKEVLETLVKRGANPFSKNHDDQGILHLGSKSYDSISEIQYLLSLCDSVDEQDSLGMSPLLYALIKRDWETCKCFLELSKSPELTNNKSENGVYMLNENFYPNEVQELIEKYHYDPFHRTIKGDNPVIRFWEIGNYLAEYINHTYDDLYYSDGSHLFERLLEKNSYNVHNLINFLNIDMKNWRSLQGDTILHYLFKHTRIKKENCCSIYTDGSSMEKNDFTGFSIFIFNVTWA